MKKHIIDFFKFLYHTDGRHPELRIKLLSNGAFPITKDELNYKGDLHLSDANIDRLPNNLHVGSGLYLTGSNIDTIPNGLHAQDLFLRLTPLSKKYTATEIRNMIEAQGGYIKRWIIV